MGQINPKQRLLDARITVGIRIIAEYIIDSCSPSIETIVSTPGMHFRRSGFRDD